MKSIYANLEGSFTLIILSSINFSNAITSTCFLINAAPLNSFFLIKLKLTYALKNDSYLD
jgi:hypothetical protein